MTTSKAAVRVNEASEKPVKSKARRRKGPGKQNAMPRKTELAREAPAPNKKVKTRKASSEKEVEKRGTTPRKRGPKREALARLRNVLGWSQTNLSAHIGGSRAYVWRTENHVSTPEPGMRDSYAAGLKITVTELEVLLANKISLDEIDEFAAKVEQRHVDDSGKLVLEEDYALPGQPNKAKATIKVPQTDGQNAVVVMLYPASDNKLATAANNDTSSVEAPAAKERPPLRLIDCTQFQDSDGVDNDQIVSTVDESTTDATTLVSQPSAVPARRRRGAKAGKRPSRRKARQKTGKTLGQLPLFKCLAEPDNEDCAPTIKQAVGG